MGSQPSVVEVHNAMHKLIALGVGRLKHLPPTGQFDPDRNYPVYIDEPLIILALNSILEKEEDKKRWTWIKNEISMSRNASSLGYIYEEFVPLLLLERFGGKYTALGDVFDLADSSLRSTRVTLVALRRSDGVMQFNKVSWKQGSSDRLIFKADCPAQVLEFIHDPKGVAFLNPDFHMHPDTLAFFQEETTEEIILFAGQDKVGKMNAQAWQAALDSVNVQLFYTQMVQLDVNLLGSILITSLPCCSPMVSECNMLLSSTQNFLRI
jgi:hypothetical protein